MRIFCAAAGSAAAMAIACLARTYHACMHASWVGERSNQYSQSDDYSWEDLATFGYKLKFENNFEKKNLLCFWRMIQPVFLLLIL
jgi:hypothetical protein